MTPEDKVYIANTMKDVKSTATNLGQSRVVGGDAMDRIELNFYRIADAITKIVGEE